MLFLEEKIQPLSKLTLPVEKSIYLLVADSFLVPCVPLYPCITLLEFKKGICLLFYGPCKLAFRSTWLTFLGFVGIPDELLQILDIFCIEFLNEGPPSSFLWKLFCETSMDLNTLSGFLRYLVSDMASILLSYLIVFMGKSFPAEGRWPSFLAMGLLLFSVMGAVPPRL